MIIFLKWSVRVGVESLQVLASCLLLTRTKCCWLVLGLPLITSLSLFYQQNSVPFTRTAVQLVWFAYLVV